MAGMVGGLRHFWRWLRRRPVGLLALSVCAAVLLAGALADLVTWHDPLQPMRGLEMAAPMTMGPTGRPLILGGDELGRDLFSRVIHGARLTIYVSVLSTVASLVIGTLVGAVAGYYGGLIDALLQRLVDIFMVVPTVVLAMVVAIVVGAGLDGVIIAVALVQWPRVARVVRADVLVARELGYVEASRSSGASDGRILARHILPNVSSSLIVMGTTGLGAAILIEGALSFLAIGATPPAPSWGLMVAAGREYLLREPRLLLVPATAISLVVLAVNIAGDTLRDYLDPRLRRNR